MGCFTYKYPWFSVHVLPSVMYHQFVIFVEFTGSLRLVYLVPYKFVVLVYLVTMYVIIPT